MHVGMNRHTGNLFWGGVRVPHARGDEPFCGGNPH